VPTELGSFENRLSFPADWRGRSGRELAAATGVDDAIFCHAAGFYASAGSREGIVALVAASIAAAK
jgi:uncharacterized UPF0160 family protein